jgi:hypothetical protein
MNDKQAQTLKLALAMPLPFKKNIKKNLISIHLSKITFTIKKKEKKKKKAQTLKSNQ